MYATEGTRLMNSRLKKVVLIILCGIIALVAVLVLIQTYRKKIVRQELADTRRELRELGFHTDLADFDVDGFRHEPV